MANETTYEVYTLAEGRWILDARFKKSQRERAIDEGRQLAKQPGIEAVKVVREIYDENDNLIKESIVYNSKKVEEGERGFSSADLAAPSYTVPGFEDLEKKIEQEKRSDIDDEDSEPERGGSLGGQRRNVRAIDAAGNIAPPPAAYRGRGLRRPELMLVYKIFIIGAVSIAFAAFTSLIFATNFS